MKRHLLFFLTLFLVLTVHAQDIDNGYHIIDWTYQAQVHKNNTWTVTETMTVEYNEERHGIFRYIPCHYVRFRDLGGKTVQYDYWTKITNIDVQGYEFSAEKKDDKQGNTVIIIGSENKLVSGQHTYVIQYQLYYPDDRYPDGDELFHSVLGADCNTTIDRFSFKISFDGKLPSDLKLHTFSGRWGAEDNTLLVFPTVEGNTISGVITEIPPFNGITLATTLSEGYWKDTLKKSDSAFYFFFYMFCALTVLCILSLMKRHRRRPTPIIEYSAPDGISSAEVGVIIDDSADLSDLTSLIVWFASKGYLKIREVATEEDDDPDIELIKLKDLPADAPEYQKIFWNIFFNKRDQVELSKLGDKHQAIIKALSALSDIFTGEKQLTSRHLPTFLGTMAAIITGTIAISNSSSILFHSDFTLPFAILGWCLPVLMAVITREHLSKRDMEKSKMWVLLQFLAITCAGALSYAIFYFFLYQEQNCLVPLSTISIILIGGWLLPLFSGRLRSDSKYRLEQMALLLGFRQFIKSSELPMLKALVDENPTYFYDVLPYAMVFGLTEKWQEQFKNIEMQTPDWYETSRSSGHITPFMASQRLSSHITSSIYHSILVSSHDPAQHTSSSSSSGFSGGFSGGGGGGGGVGSW